MKINARKLTTLAVFAAAMIALQVAMSPLPNIEPVTLLIILCTVLLGPQVFLAIAVFVLAEGLIYGFGLWWFGYLYVWALLAGAVLLLRRYSHPLLWALTAGIFGLLFGTLCSPITFFTGGWAAGLAWIVNGLPYDLMHGVSNLILTLVLYYPLEKALKKILKV